MSTGLLSFSSSSCFSDLVHSSLMGFDWNKIPLLEKGFAQFKYPLTKKRVQECEVCYNGEKMSLLEVGDRLGHRFLAPSGWKKVLS